MKRGSERRLIEGVLVGLIGMAVGQIAIETVLLPEVRVGGTVDAGRIPTFQVPAAPVAAQTPPSNPTVFPSTAPSAARSAASVARVSPTSVAPVRTSSVPVVTSPVSAPPSNPASPPSQAAIVQVSVPIVPLPTVNVLGVVRVS